MYTQNYQFKLELNSQQTQTVEQILTACRKVWNYALRERKDWSNSRKCSVNFCSIEREYIIAADTPYPDLHHQSKALTEAKKANAELKEINAQVLQQVLRQLDRAFTEMKSLNKGFPRFKNKYRMRSFVFPQFKTNPIANDYIKLPQIGLVKMRLSRPLPDGFVLKQARVIRKASGYFINLTCQLDINIPQPSPHGHPLGVDIGLEKFIATSDGQTVNRPKFFLHLSSKLKLLQRRLKNKPSGSNNRHKLNQKIARLHQKVSDTRKDYHYKLAHHLCTGTGMIFVEDIDFRVWAKGMFKKHTLDASFGQFFQILEYVAWKRGIYFAKVDKNYTSQTCPACGAHTGKKALDERVHYCHECGFTCQRDVAAAMIIRDRGLNAVGRTVLENAQRDVLSGSKVT